MLCSQGVKEVIAVSVKFEARAKRGRQSHEAKYPSVLDARCTLYYLSGSLWTCDGEVGFVKNALYLFD